MNFNKVKCLENSKRPAENWKNTPLTKERKSKNYGILTGFKNDITVIDLDFYNKKNKNFKKEDSLFIKEFGIDFINFFNTYTQKSPSGGFHLFFKYDKSIKQTASEEHQIDIRSDGGYVLGVGSVINNNEYTIYKDTSIKEIPKKLKDWLLNNLYSKKELLKVKDENDKPIIKTTTIYKYKYEEEILRKIFDRLPKEYYTDYGTGKTGHKTWLNFSTFCKTVNCLDLWDEYSKKYSKGKYNKNQNIAMLNNIDTNKITCFNKIFNEKTLKELKNYKYYMRYKPLPKYNLKVNKKINSQKLGYDFFNKNKGNLIIKSDTGTGKTTSFKHYAKENKIKFISVVSRVSLGQEQYNVFNKFGLECDFYQYADFENGNSYIVQIDSLSKLYESGINLNEYTFFFDEYNSIIEHLINSNTMTKNRMDIFSYLIKVFNKCLNFICVDADISEVSIKFLNLCDQEYKIIKNEYLHNKNILANEINCYHELLKKIKSKSYFMVCCDSKTDAISLYKHLDDENIKLITSETEEHINLDKYDKIIYSPKIIYGLDSQIKRDVFCYYSTQTINPAHMLQQIGRTRNIKSLYYHFYNRRLNDCFYGDLKNCIEYNKGCTKLKKEYNKIDSIKSKIRKHYFKLYCLLDYKNDCFKSNIFLHFIELLEKRGFKIIDGYGKRGKTTTRDKEKKILKNEYLQDIFNKNSISFKNVNKILKLKTSDIEKYKEVICDSSLISEHFNICNYQYKNDCILEEEIFKLNEIPIKKIKHTKNKILFLRHLVNKVKFGIYNNIFDCSSEINDEENEDLIKNYNSLFRDRSKNKICFKNNSNCISIIIKIFKSIFTTNFFESKRITKNKKKITVYKMKEPLENYHRELYLKRNVIETDNEYFFKVYD